MTPISQEKYSNFYSLIGKMLIVRYDLQAETIPDFGDVQNVILNGEVNASLGEESSYKKLQKTIQEISKQVVGLITIDYEGGRICRWGGDMPSVPSAYALSLVPDELERAGEIMGKQLRALGVDMVLGPTVDNGGPHSAFPARCYGKTPDEIIQKVEVVLNGLNKYVFTCLKHYPNHGAVEGDSHEGLPESSSDLPVFESNYLPHFQALAKHAAAIMTAHIFVKKWDEENPATFSKKILDWLRDREINKIIITDSLTMGAVEKKYGGDIVKAAAAALRAGADMLIAGSLSIDQVKVLREQLTEMAMSDKCLRRRIKASSIRINDLMAKRQHKYASEDIEALALEAESFTAQAAEKVLFSAGPFVNTPLVHSPQTVILAPRLMCEKVKDGYRKVFLEFPNAIFWEGSSPTEEEVCMISQQVSAMQDVVVITYNGDRDNMQQKLILSFSNACVRICEVNFAHEHMSWVPPKFDAVCTYSGDPVSLSVAFKKFAKGNF